MNSYWKILGLSQSTIDKTIIKEAYAKELKKLDLNRDIQEFMKLRQAYELAIRYADASKPTQKNKKASVNSDGFENEVSGEKRKKCKTNDKKSPNNTKSHVSDQTLQIDILAITKKIFELALHNEELAIAQFETLFDDASTPHKSLKLFESEISSLLSESKTLLPKTILYFSNYFSWVDDDNYINSNSKVFNKLIPIIIAVSALTELVNILDNTSKHDYSTIMASQILLSGGYNRQLIRLRWFHSSRIHELVCAYLGQLSPIIENGINSTLYSLDNLKYHDIKSKKKPLYIVNKFYEIKRRLHINRLAQLEYIYYMTILVSLIILLRTQYNVLPSKLNITVMTDSDGNMVWWILIFGIACILRLANLRLHDLNQSISDLFTVNLVNGIVIFIFPYLWLLGFFTVLTLIPIYAFCMNGDRGSNKYGPPRPHYTRIFKYKLTMALIVLWLEIHFML